MRRKGAWADELESILWSYRITLQSTTDETLFKLTYRVDAMIPVDIEEPNPQVIFQSTNSQAFRKEADLTHEVREIAHVRERALKHRITNRYNADIIPRKFQQGDLVL